MARSTIASWSVRPSRQLEDLTIPDRAHRRQLGPDPGARGEAPHLLHETSRHHRSEALGDGPMEVRPVGGLECEPDERPGDPGRAARSRSGAIR